MENKAKIRINLNSREFEIEGSEDFINSHSEKIDSFLNILRTAPPLPQQAPPQQPINGSGPTTGHKSGKHDNVIPESFGEYFHLLPNNSKDMDKVLLAGYFSQLKSESGNFGTNDTTQLLIDQGVKISNPSQTIKNNIDAKRIIKLTKGKFKASKEGVDYINQLLSGNGN